MRPRQLSAGPCWQDRLTRAVFRTQYLARRTPVRRPGPAGQFSREATGADHLLRARMFRTYRQPAAFCLAACAPRQWRGEKDPVMGQGDRRYVVVSAAGRFVDPQAFAPKRLEHDIVTGTSARRAMARMQAGLGDEDGAHLVRCPPPRCRDRPRRDRPRTAARREPGGACLQTLARSNSSGRRSPPGGNDPLSRRSGPTCAAPAHGRSPAMNRHSVSRIGIRLHSLPRLICRTAEAHPRLLESDKAF